MFQKLKKCLKVRGCEINKLNLEQKIVALIPMITGLIVIPLMSAFSDFASNHGSMSLANIINEFKSYSSFFSWYQLLPFFVFSQYLFAFVMNSTRKRAYKQVITGVLIIVLFYFAGDLFTVGKNEHYAIGIWHILRPVILIPILYLGLYLAKCFIEK